ncbi:hypothetical protein GCM10022237_37810 [Nocardioides ginsengisoli]
MVCLPLFALLGSGQFGSSVGTVSAFAGVRPLHGPQPTHDVLALGDSVPSGRSCDCDPFPVTYGAELSQRTGARVTVDNRAVSGLDTEGLMQQLQGPGMQDAVRRADIVLLTIGANDFGDHHDDVVTGACTQGNSDCVSDELSSLRSHLASVIDTIRALRGGQQTEILVTGYWNVFEDGAVAREEFGEAGLQQSLDLTVRANAVISAVSADTGARYVDLFAPFEESGRDVTSLVAADGDHPDAAGHQLIANALLDAWTPRPG